MKQLESNLIDQNNRKQTTKKMNVKTIKKAAEILQNIYSRSLFALRQNSQLRTEMRCKILNFSSKVLLNIRKQNLPCTQFFLRRQTSRNDHGLLKLRNPKSARYNNFSFFHSFSHRSLKPGFP